MIYKENKRVKNYVEQYDFDKKSGTVELSINNEYLKQMENHKLQREPKIEMPGEDLINLKTTFFVKYEDTTDNNQYDIALYPVELDFETELYFHKPKGEPKMFPLVDGGLKDFRISLRDCEFAYNPLIVGKTDEDDEDDFFDTDDEDFDSDDDETPTGGDGMRKFKKSNTQYLICGLKQLGNDAQKERKNKEAMAEYVKMFFETGLSFFQLLGHNDTQSFGLGCSGFDVFGPKLKFKNERLWINMKIDKTDTRKVPEEYCDSVHGDLYLAHPYILWNTHHLMKDLKHNIMVEKESHIFHWM